MAHYECSKCSVTLFHEDHDLGCPNKRDYLDRQRRDYVYCEDCGWLSGYHSNPSCKGRLIQVKFKPDSTECFVYTPPKEIIEEKKSDRLHILKCAQLYFQKVVDGTKTFEVRKNDRGFQVGDYILLNETTNEPDGYTNVMTGQNQLVQITYILLGGNFGIDKDYCVLGIKKV